MTEPPESPVSPVSNSPVDTGRVEEVISLRVCKLTVLAAYTN